MNEDFLYALMGGGLIGLSAFLLLYFNGKVCGISGIVGSAITRSGLWRWAFILGLLCSGLLLSPLSIQTISLSSDANTNLILMGVAGLIVGVGTTLGSGCTSGHGIVGLGRFSKRSLTATGVFMLTAMITVFVVNHLV